MLEFGAWVCDLMHVAHLVFRMYTSRTILDH